ncbi:ring zinc finger protein [Cystoisospora suis]|uniref:RING-type E3 ubiquitin transferase n=1 Tax=Cystoisospora suis TaxID=483139 RepID=A0A2C6LHU8_9APIC|nr:ring zinc finger protein [Cystoisospora suis]
MGGIASRDRQELANRTSFGPQQIISVPSLGGNTIGGPSAAPLLPQPPTTRFGSLGGQADAAAPVEQVPRLSVQQTCVVKNPVNLHKHSLKCYKDPSFPDRLFFSFSFDASTPVDVSIHYFAHHLTDPVTGTPSFNSRLPYPLTPPRRLPSGMRQTFCTAPEEALLIADFDQQQAILESDKEDEDNDVYPVTVCLYSVDLASATQPGGGPGASVKNQYTFAQLVKTSRRSSSASASSLLGSNTVEGKDSSEEERAVDWRCPVVRQKIQFGSRTFEVQEIFGIERGNSTEMQCFPSPASSRQSVSADDETDQRANAHQSDHLAGRECVICLAEERNTAVLPCRHMCLCSGCANIMRMQSNKCPICRQPVTSLLQITLKNSSQ